MKLTMAVPRLRLWHLIGLVAATAAYLAVFDLRWTVEDPVYVALKRLRSSDPDERLRAAAEFQGMGSKGARAVEPLLEALNDSDVRVRVQATRGLVSVIQGVKDESTIKAVRATLVAMLKASNREDKVAAALALSSMSNEPNTAESKLAIPILIDAMSWASWQDRLSSINILGFYTKEDERAFKIVFAAIKDKDQWVRNMAVRSLAICIREKARTQQIVQALMPLLKDDSQYVRSSVVLALGWYDGLSPEELNELESHVNDPDPEVRRMVVQCHPKDVSQRWVEKIAKALEDPNKLVREAAISKLTQLKGDAEIALPALARLKDDPENELHREAERAFETIQTAVRDFNEKYLPELLQDARAGSEVEKCQAIAMLGDLGHKAAKSIPDLIHCLDDAEPSVRVASAVALAKFGAEAGAAIPSLEANANDANQDVSRAARGALAKIPKP
ncbi:HEAT repeat domain-containing protein [Singulisphaera sp. PoT]|uniref:HEAT repeat domain-containing protein n=1 Tax=Singulisphaera sp. PoT TaxID=3411797 RepID=UPI003BF55CD6